MAKNVFSEVTVGEQLQTIKEQIKGTGKLFHTSKGKVLKNLEKLDY